MVKLTRMTSVLPASFLFRFEFPVRRDPRGPRHQGHLLSLGEQHTLTWPVTLNGQHVPGALRMGWTPEGLGISWMRRGKTRPVETSTQPGLGDGLHLWLDTRATQNVHRATRFCHYFVLHPETGAGGAESARVVQLPFARTSELELMASGAHHVVSQFVIHPDGYELHAFFNDEALNGFLGEPDARLGFYALVRDAESGDHPLTVGREFPFDYDPSLWQNLRLVDA